MIHLIERYLDRINPRLGAIFLLIVLIWIAIGGAVVLYGVGVAVYGLINVTEDAIFGTGTSFWGIGSRFWKIVFAVTIWLLLLLALYPIVVMRRLRREHREEKRSAGIALTRLEKAVFTDEKATSDLKPARNRLALRALERMEQEILGETQPADLFIEERLIALDRKQKMPAE